MFIPLNPCSISDILPLKKETVFFGTPWRSKESDRVILFSRGQWALRELGFSIIEKQKLTRGRILIPEYFCEISLTTLRTNEFDIGFYRITPGLEPDIADLERIAAADGPPDVMLFVHYFGIPLNMSASESWCRENGVVLIEDAAHSLLPVPGIGDHELPVIYTPWKFLSLLNGALLVLPDTSGISVKILESDDSYPLQWVAKQAASTVATSLAMNTGLPLHKIRKIRVKECDESEPSIDPGHPACSRLSAASLAKKGKNIPAVASAREQNYRKIDEVISNSAAHTHRIIQSLPGCFAPYVYPLRIEGEMCRDIMVALNKNGIPAQPWSDLSPEVKDSKEYPLSNALRREVMVLPVHQDLTPSQVEWMSREVIRHLSRN